MGPRQSGGNLLIQDRLLFSPVLTNVTLNSKLRVSSDCVKLLTGPPMETVR